MTDGAETEAEAAGVGVTAYMPLANYIRRMVLPLQSRGKSVAGARAVVYNPNEIRAEEIRGLSGVVAASEEDSAVAEARGMTRKRGVAEWLEITIPPETEYLRLDDELEAQSETVRGAILAPTALSTLFKRDAGVIWQKIDEEVKSFSPADRQIRANFEIGEFYRYKREEIMSLRTARAYVNFLNDRGCTHDCNMTASYLYSVCGVKGLRYQDDDDGDHFLLFNARDDITISELCRAAETD